jgi:GalNAc-alpha-(1->4)-GalNAc-alpha-(1->3)-diNAcBac-PP-undecaprenol alpha-1,4-N-acetyl-D-galactosaminyltransferase
MADRVTQPVSAARRITFVTSSLDVGGASRVITLLANAWAATGALVSVVTLDWERDPYFSMDSRVHVQHLDLIKTSDNLVAAIRNNIERVVRLRKAISATRPDVVISFGDRSNVRALLATIRQRWPIIVADRTSAQPMSGWAWRWLRLLTYRRADGYVLQTQAMARTTPRFLRSRATVIPNPVVVPEVSHRPVGDRHDVVALGRLVPQKGFDLLIEAFASVTATDPRVHLTIVGGGEEEEALRAQIERLGLGERISMPGQTEAPGDALAGATMFVLSSRVEGFPNALLEAMALGLPVVAFDCAYGPGEIVRDGVDGILVPDGDVPGLASAIRRLLASPDLRSSMGEKAREVRDRFAAAGVAAQWDALVEATIAHRRRS